MPATIQTVKVVDLVPFGPGGEGGEFFALRLTCPEWTDGWVPGQYVMLRPESWGMEMPWARPLSICLVTRELVLFFQAVGRGTERLRQLRFEDEVQILGPLGNGFAVEPEVPTLLLAGGMGIVPFVGYVQQHPTPWTLNLHFGHRFPLGSYPYENFTDKIEAENYREFGPEDREKFVEVLDRQISAFSKKNGLVLACGPNPFLRTVQALALRHEARAQLSLEERMACGVGACLGCVVKPFMSGDGKRNFSKQNVHPDLHKGAPVPSCTCGPVFWADSIDLN